nr:hypothetical protein [Hymenobacter sp. BRD67]
MVLATRAGHGGGQLTVADGPAQRNEAAYYPQHEQRETALDA